MTRSVKLQKNKDCRNDEEDNSWQPASDQMIDILEYKDMGRYETGRKKVFIPTYLLGYEREDFFQRVLGSLEGLFFVFCFLFFFLKRMTQEE